MENPLNTSTYKIKDFSNVAFGGILILFWLAALVLNVFLLNKCDNQLIIIISLTLFVVGTIILCAIHLKGGSVEISITEKYMGLKWIKKPLFLKKQDMNIRWGNIKNYIFDEGSRSETFKLILKDNTKIKLVHSYSYKKSDFRKFKQAFKDKVNSVNLEGLNKIELGKTIYEGISGIILAIVIIIALISIIILMAKNPDRALSTNPFLMVLVFGGGFSYLFKILIINLHKLNK